MTNVQRAPVPALLRVADELEATVGRFRRARQSPKGYWEALDEAHVMGNLCVRQIEGTVELARIDMVLLPAAWATARSAFEIATRIRWLLSPNDEFEREARWVARLREGARYWRQIGDRIRAIGGASEPFDQNAVIIDGFADGVSQKLPAGVLVRAIPSFDSIVAEFDPKQYVGYKMASQYTHGTHEGGGLYRRHLGTAKQFHERTEPGQWADPMVCCWWALAGGLAIAVLASGGDHEEYLPEASVERISDAFADLRAASVS